MKNIVMFIIAAIAMLLFAKADMGSKVSLDYMARDGYYGDSEMDRIFRDYGEDAGRGSYLEDRSRGSGGNSMDYRSRGSDSSLDYRGRAANGRFVSRR